MKPEAAPTVSYKRSRFSTRLPVGRRYTGSHYWLLEEQPGRWRVGFTKFATRMLGDLVEYGFGVQVGDAVQIGQAIGWVEGFKAVADLYCVVDGEFQGVNPQLAQDITVVESDPYGSGWLYRAQGAPESNSVDVNDYIAVLDATIDKMLSERHEGKDAAR